MRWSFTMIRKCLFSLLLIGSWYVLNAQEEKGQLICESCNIEQILKQIEANQKVSFSYPSGIFPINKSFSFIVDSSYRERLSILLQNQDLWLEAVNENFFVIKKKKSRSKIISGQVLDAETQKPIPSAFISGNYFSSGSQSNQEGRFTLSVPENIITNITISHLGYQELNLQLDPNFQKEPIAVLLKPALIQLKPVLVREIRSRNSKKSNDSSVLNIMEWLPNHHELGPWVEGDALRSFKLFPGISSTDESATRLNIRGGTPDQNLILWDNIPIYHSGHFFGFFSSFNLDMIEQVSVNKGYFSPKFGSRSGGLINFKTLTKPPKEKRTKIQLSPFSISGITGFSLPNQKVGLIIAGNKSLTENIPYWGTRNLFNQVFQYGRIAEEQYIEDAVKSRSSNVQFYDFQIKGYYHPSKKDNLSVSVYSGLDIFKNHFEGLLLKSNDYWKEGNYGWNISYHKELSNNWNTLIDLTGSKFSKQKINELAEGLNRYVFFENNLSENNFRWELKKVWNQKSHFIAGVQLKNRSYFKSLLLEIDGFRAFGELENLRLKNTVLYTEYNGWLSEHLKLETGFRFSSMGNIQTQEFLEPRVQLKWISSKKNWEFYFSASKFIQEVYQTPHLYNELDIESNIWQLADFDQYPVIRSREYSLGIKNNSGPIFWSLGVFDKKNQGVMAWKMNLGFDDINLFEEVGNIQSSGLEWLIKYEQSNLDIYLSYTLSKAYQQYPNINFGQPFLANHHQSHHLNINQVFFLKKWEGGFNFRFIKGRPFSQPVGIDQLIESNGEVVYFPKYESLNSSQIPIYHRLDLFFRYSFELKSTLIKMDFTLFNLFNTTNIQEVLNYVYSPNPSIGILEPELVSIKNEMLPFTPFFSFRFEF